jgi:hypothetical protein
MDPIAENSIANVYGFEYSPHLPMVELARQVSWQMKGNLKMECNLTDLSSSYPFLLGILTAMIIMIAICTMLPSYTLSNLIKISKCSR